jgi:hypothetical protein
MTTTFSRSELIIIQTALDCLREHGETHVQKLRQRNWNEVAIQLQAQLALLDDVERHVQEGVQVD